METRDAYNSWAASYDSDMNKTRDLEATAIRSVLGDKLFGQTLEIGCGTGKNTAWLAEKSKGMIAVDFSTSMLEKAKQKIQSSKIRFLQVDITKPWALGKVDLISCSLVLEHIEDIDFVFQQAAESLSSGGRFYLCELHPYKQLQGSRAKFEQDGNTLQLEYFVHHVSAFHDAARQNGLACDQLQEWFDDGEKNMMPRLISFLFRKE
jgi:SAM-dependent methyltransferase